MTTSAPNAPYHHGNLRQALLETALLMLEQQGEAGLGLRDLARAIGVSSAAPYRHFDSRAALLEALAVTGFQRFGSRMQAVAASEPSDPVSAMGKTYVVFALQNPNLFRLMFSPLVQSRPGLRMAADTALETLHLLVGGEKPAARIRTLAAWAKVHGLAILLLDGQIAMRAGEDSEALVAAIISGL